AGLSANERCVWVAGAPLGKARARELMRAAVPGFDLLAERGQMDIRDETAAAMPWHEEAERAAAAGYEGLRGAGEDLCRGGEVFGRERLLALCTYCMQALGAQDVIDIVRHHQFALARRQGQWEVLESASRRNRALEEALR